MNMIKAKLKEVQLEGLEEFKFNEYFNAKNGNSKNNVIIECYIPDNKDINYQLYYQRYVKYAFDFAIPSFFISAYCNDNVYEMNWKNIIMMSYYGKSQYKSEKVNQISEEKINYVKKWHQIIIKYYTETLKYQDGKFTPWDVAFNEYIDATYCSYAEQSFMHLITAIEALLVNGNSELNYRASLNSAMLCGNTYEERVKIFNLVKKAYKIRSSVVHGDATAIQKQLRPDDIYNTLFDLREVVSDALYKTFEKDKNKTIENIEQLILT